MKKALHKTGLFVLLALVFACQNEFRPIDNSVREGVITEMQVKKVLIKIDSLSLTNEYYIYYDSYESDNKIYLLSYNAKTHSLDILNISGRQVEEHISLANDGPDGISDIFGLNVITPDSILLVDNFKFCIINHTGKIIWKLIRNDPNILKDLPAAYLVTGSSFMPGYNAREKGIVLYFNPVDRNECFKLPMLIQISLDTVKAKLLPFYLPTSLKSDMGFSPVYNGPRACFENDKIVINFAKESNIYTYNYADKKVNAFGGRSKYVPDKVRSMEKGENPTDCALTTSCFYKVVYDPYKNLYYRAQWGEMNLKKSEFEYNTFYDKPVFLTVFDENFNYLFETRIEIESGISTEQLIPTPEGLLVFPLKQQIENFDENLEVAFLLSFSKL